METRALPVGIQSFETIRGNNYLYIDKTEIIYKIVSKATPYFLNRPQGFSKKILLSTIKSYFEGRSDLFKGLAIETLEKDWTTYPVLYFDFSKATKNTSFKSIINSVFDEYESLYNTTYSKKNFYSGRLTNLIRAAYTLTNRKVVILLNEYDAPVRNAKGNEKNRV